MAFVMMVFTLVRAFSSRIAKRSLDKNSEVDDDYSTYSLDYSTTKEEFRPPSPAPGFTEADVLSSVLKRLAELEEKIDVLQSKPSEMPSEKEELLNAAVRRVDALEAELIVTKKVISVSCIILERIQVGAPSYTMGSFVFLICLFSLLVVVSRPCMMLL